MHRKMVHCALHCALTKMLIFFASKNGPLCAVQLCTVRKCWFLCVGKCSTVHCAQKKCWLFMCRKMFHCALCALCAKKKWWFVMCRKMVHCAHCAQMLIFFMRQKMVSWVLNTKLLGILIAEWHEKCRKFRFFLSAKFRVIFGQFLKFFFEPESHALGVSKNMKQSKIGWRTSKRRGLKVCKKNLQKLLPCCSMVKKKEDFSTMKPQLSIYGSVHHEKRKTRSANSALRASFASLEKCMKYVDQGHHICMAFYYTTERLQ